MRKSYSFAVTVLVIISSFFSLATHSLANTAFDLVKANNTFDKISIKLATQNLNQNDFRQAVERLEAIQASANQCVDETSANLLKLDELQKSLADPTVQDKAKEKVNYISQKKEAYVKERAGCKLFIYRVQEAVEAYKKTLKELSTKELFFSHKPLWQTLEQLYNTDELIVDWQKIADTIGLTQLIDISMSSALIFFSALFLLGLYLRYLLGLLVGSGEQPGFLAELSLALKTYVIPITLLLASIAYLLFSSVNSQDILLSVCYNTLSLLTVLVALRWAVISNCHQDETFRLPSQFIVSSKGLFFFAWLHITGNGLIDQLDIAIEIKNIAASVGAIMFVFLYTYWFSCLTKVIVAKNSLYQRFILFFKLFLLAIVLSSSVMGYYHVATFTIDSVFKSTLCLMFFWWAFHATSSWYNDFNDKELTTGKQIKELLSIEPDKLLIEVLLLKLVVQVTLISTLAIAFFSIWAVTTHFFDLMEETLFFQVKLGGFAFSLYRVVLGIVVFSSILLVGRLAASMAVDSKKYKKSGDTQVVLSSMIVYISFGLAFILGLIATGVDFTGLAIIAGALSVGVGLGLQNIVNNFVSGLILLIEQPIKPGDRVVVGTTEGIVQKISIRSTQIKTMAKEDVIVPNADLIANQVTNYMFKDKNFRIVCQVGVAYGSDTEKVCQLLTEAAVNNPDVLNNSTNFPKILFRQFGDSSLVFELWSTIKDVNKKYVIQSELNLAIDKLFREHQVVIAFPQMDLHVKEVPQAMKTADETTV